MIMIINDYSNFLKEYAKCRQRALERLNLYCGKNQCTLNEYIADFFDRAVYGIPDDANFIKVIPVSIDNGVITLQVQFMGQSGDLFISHYMVTLDDLELYKKLKAK